MDRSYSIVEYMNNHSGYRCGYCKSPNTNYSHGMWGHKMTVNVYQDLINRGWRRSGQYCYKPTMNLTCCPQYAIRCNATEVKLTKSQKKVARKMKHFLCYAKNSPAQMESELVTGDSGNMSIFGAENKAEGTEKLCMSVSSSSKTIRPGEGVDPTRPACRKAKVIRKERKLAKQKNREQSDESKMECEQSKCNNSLSVEELIIIDGSLHKLELRLVRSSPPSDEFVGTFEKSYNVYQTYQQTVHGDKPEKCTQKQYKRFLCKSPLQPWNPSDGPPTGYGSFHHQYWLDGELIAVGVLDILPKCVSSVYFYYDPKFSFLSLGTYSSLREIVLTRHLYSIKSDIMWYYMGYYIHSCPKMRYKGQYFPSYLLCPETYTWQPIENCRPKLDKNKYSRLVEDSDAIDETCVNDISQVMCLYRGHPMPYELYRMIEKNAEDEEEVKEYTCLVGHTCLDTVLLYRDCGS